MADIAVMIIGGGIGGLTLAHGLHRAGLPVRVFERTHERDDWLQGYRIHINPAGARALHDCLPPAGWRAFLDAVSPGGGFGFLTDRGTDLLGLTEQEIQPGAGPADRHYGIGRVELRRVLLDGLGDVVRHGRACTGYEVAGDRVVAHFADGSDATGDLLVGADGANSGIRARLLPHAGRVDTGVVTVAGRCPTTEGLSPALTTRANVVLPRGRGSLFTAAWTGDAGDQVLWGYSDAAGRFPADVASLPGAALRRLVRDRIRTWSPLFHRLVDHSDEATVNAFPVTSATPVRPWPSGPVTLLGDAIHHMTPMAGVGANTALRDADLLRRALLAVAAGEVPLRAAVARYEREMIGYGFAAVRRSYRNARRAGHGSALGRAVFRTSLRVTAAVPPLRRGLARGLGR